MSLRQCLKEHTHRELLVWNAWLDQEWDNPSRSDWYAMQVAAEVQRLYEQRLKSPKPVQVKDMKLNFTTEKDANKPLRVEKKVATAWSKARWFSWLGGRKNIRTEKR